MAPFRSGMPEPPAERAADDLRELVERQRAAIDRLERKVDALADELGVGFAGRCRHCEDGVLQWSDGALVCSDCGFSQPV